MKNKRLVILIALFLALILLIIQSIMLIDLRNTYKRIQNIKYEKIELQHNVFDVKCDCQKEKDINITETIVKTELTAEEKQPVLLGEFRLTAYCSCYKCCGEYALNRPIDENGNEVVYGSIGEILTEGYSIAVDPDVIPYGTEVIIDGITYKAQDCGGEIDGNEIDVYFSDHEKANEFAVQYKDVYLKGE